MTLIEIAGSGLAALLLLATVAWLYGLFAKNPIELERHWGTGLALVAAIYFVLVAQREWRQWVVLLTVLLWSVRHTRESRFWPLREKSRLTAAQITARPIFMLRQHYLFQALQIFFMSAPIFVLMTNGDVKKFTAFDGIGLLSLAAGLYLSARGSARLQSLQSRLEQTTPEALQSLPRSMDAVVKEPHHYGELTSWSAFYILALAVPSGFLTLFSPVLFNRHLRRFEEKRRPAVHK